jgi:hypothetical protein
MYYRVSLVSRTHAVTEPFGFEVRVAPTSSSHLCAPTKNPKRLAVPRRHHSSSRCRLHHAHQDWNQRIRPYWPPCNACRSGQSGRYVLIDLKEHTWSVVGGASTPSDLKAATDNWVFLSVSYLEHWFSYLTAHSLFVTTTRSGCGGRQRSVLDPRLCRLPLQVRLCARNIPRRSLS